jgi:hypothetical protein
MDNGIAMSTMSETIPTRIRTPDDIAFELTTYRDSIRASLKAHSVDTNERSSPQSMYTQQVLRAIGAAQQYIQAFVQSTITPASVVQFVTKRPILVGVAVGVIALAGPRRLFGWAAKAVTIWKIASAIRG